MEFVMELKLLDIKPPQQHSQEHEPVIGLTASEYTNSLGLVKFKTFSHRSSSGGHGSSLIGGDNMHHQRAQARHSRYAMRQRPESKGQTSPSQAGEMGAMGESGLGWPLGEESEASPRFDLTSTTLPLKNGVIKSFAVYDENGTCLAIRLSLLLYLDVVYFFSVSHS
jgi:hypothetical protein